MLHITGASGKFAGVTAVPEGMGGGDGYRAGASPAPTIDGSLSSKDLADAPITAYPPFGGTIERPHAKGGMTWRRSEWWRGHRRRCLELVHARLQTSLR